MTKLILLVGIPGSGKSTWAREYAADKENRAVRINNDDLRKMLNGGVLYDWRNEDLISAIVNKMVVESLSSGYNVILDNVNLSRKHYDFWNNFCAGYYELEMKVFDTPLDICIERDKLRERSIGEKRIREMHNVFVKNWSEK